VSDASEISQASPLIHASRGQAPEQIERALHLWASQLSHKLFQPSPEQLIVVAAVYSLASQRRIA
jgi:hypothetical protein